MAAPAEAAARPAWVRRGVGEVRDAVTTHAPRVSRHLSQSAEMTVAHSPAPAIGAVGGALPGNPGGFRHARAGRDDYDEDDQRDQPVRSGVSYGSFSQWASGTCCTPHSATAGQRRLLRRCCKKCGILEGVTGRKGALRALVHK